MRMNQFCKWAIVILSICTLAACSTTKNGRNGMAGQGGTYSMGLGSQDGMGGTTLASSYSTKAPSNQIYYFDYDASELHPEYLPSIDAQAKYLAEHPNARILLTGNTDSRGSREYNIALGERRAQGVAQRMKSLGVRSNQLRLVSYGSERPAALGNSDDDYAKNRRVELVYETLS